MEKYHENKTARDDEYIAAYLKYHSQLKAAEECGCGRETIARAVRRANIKLDGRRFNGKDQGEAGKQTKITDHELIRECVSFTASELALKHHMNPCNVERRLRRLGLKCKSGVGVGSGRSHYIKRAKAYQVEYDETITLVSVFERFSGVCSLCGEKTDFYDRNGSRIGKRYPTIDHIIPLSKGGSHTWENVQLAHMICNSKKGAVMGSR